MSTALSLVLAAVFAVQDPSEAIYDPNFIRTFNLTLNPADWDAICNDGTGAGDQWKRGSMTWEGETVDGVGIKRSGQGTAGLQTPKPSIRISFNEFEFDALKRKWRNVNRIKLDSMVGNTDPAMMRDRVAYGLFRSAGAPVSRMAHCKLYVNGAFKGLYCTEEPIRKDYYRYRWGSDDDGNSYNMHGGGSNSYDYKGTNPGSYIPAPFDEESNWPTGTFTDIIELCNSVTNFPGDQIRGRLDGQILLDGFLRHLAVTTVYGDNDDISHWGGGWVNNHFWYHHESGKMEILKWDPGASQGLYESDMGIPKGQAPLGYRYENVKMTAWVKNDPTAWSIYKSKILGIINGSGADVQARIDAIYNQIRDTAYGDPLKPFSNAEFDAGKDWLKDWYARRYAYLRSQLQTNNAAFVSQTVPASMTAGQTYSVTVKMKNTGTTTWVDPDYKLGSQNPTDNMTWGMNRVATPGSIGPNAEVSYTWNVTAPATAGTYSFQWQMRQSGVEWFGAMTPNVSVTVTSTPQPPPPPPPPPPPTDVNDAEFVSQTVPTTMVAGQSYGVTVTMKNVGTTTWDAPDIFRLGSQNPQDNMTWGMNRVSMPAGSTIAPGQQVTYSWSVTAPATPTTYNFQWQCKKSGAEWFGDLTPNLVITVTSTTPPPPPPPPPPPTATNDAAFVSQTVPATMVAGQTYTVTVRMKNTGTTTWDDPNIFRLGSQNPQDNMTWGMNRVAMPAGSTISPGQEVTYSWTVTAPATPNTYDFQWQCKKSGAEWFGELTPDVVVTVTSTPPPPPPPTGTNAAAFVAQNVSSSMKTGKTYSVSVTMRNTGSTTWTEAGQYRLSSRGPRDNTVWGLNRVTLAAGDSVAPGENHTFKFDVTAPTTAGSYNFSWSMVQDGVDWFNDVSPALAITVSDSAKGGGSSAGNSIDVNKTWDRCFGSIQGGGGTPFTAALCALASLLLSTLRRPRGA